MYPLSAPYYLNPSEFFYYPSPQNHFWNRMENIFPDWKLKRTKSSNNSSTLAENIEKKKEFCALYKIGFLDVFEAVDRKRKGSRDVDLIPVIDIVGSGTLFEVLEKHSSINSICCTYSLAYSILRTKLDSKQIEALPHDETANGESLKWKYNGRVITIFLLFPATRSGQKNFIKDRQYSNLIFGI